MMGQIVTVNFRQDTLFAVERDDGVFVAAKPIAERLGLDWKGQHQRLKDDPVLSEGMEIISIPSPGGTQETTCLRLDLLNGWLFKVDTRRIKPELRDAIISYQKECYATLFEHFHGKAKTDPAPKMEDDPQENEAVKLRQVTEARHTFGNQAAAQLWFRLGLPTVPAMLHDPRQITLFDYSAIKAAPPEGEAA